MRYKPTIPVGTCAAARCNEPSTVIIDLAGAERFELCDRHLQQRGDEQERDNGREAPTTEERSDE